MTMCQGMAEPHRDKSSLLSIRANCRQTGQKTGTRCVKWLWYASAVLSKQTEPWWTYGCHVEPAEQQFRHVRKTHGVEMGSRAGT